MLSGIFISMNYTSHIDLAFNSVEYIMRDGAGSSVLVTFLCLTRLARVFKTLFVKPSTSRGQVCYNYHLVLHQPLATLEYRRRQREINLSCLKLAIANFAYSFLAFAGIETTNFSMMVVFNRTLICVLKHIYMKTESLPYSFTKVRQRESRKKFFSQLTKNKNGMAFHSKIEIFNSEKDTFFKEAVSPENLMVAWTQLKSNPGFVPLKTVSESVNDIDLKWFEKTSLKLIDGKFQYSVRRRIKIPKPNSTELRPITISSPRTKIIEKALLNVLEPFFEGVWEWGMSSEKEIKDLLQKKLIQRNDYKQNKDGWFIRSWLQPQIFHSSSHGFRKGKSTHSALKTIKEWAKNVVWLLDYDIKKAFDNVHRNRLRNIFLKHINQPQVWKEIEKMMNTGIIDINLIFEAKGVAQGSVLSPFLFNIYMNELDSFVAELRQEKFSFLFKEDMDGSVAMKNYKRIKAEFSNARIHTALKKYGSVENVRNELNTQLKNHYKTYGRHYGINTKTRQTFYTRYVDDFVFGVVGPKSFAIEIRSLVNDFLKSNLHLNVSKCQLINRNGKGIKFLGYLIYLPTFSKKVRTLPNKIQTIKRYKRRVLARFRLSDERLAKAAFFTARSSLLSVYRILLNSNADNKWAKTNIDKASQTLLNSSNFNDNPALKRWVNSSKSKAVKEMFFASKFYIENLQSLPEWDKSDNEILDKIKSARDTFLNNLDSIYQEEFEQIQNERREKVLKIKAKIDKSKSKNKISEAEAVQLADILTQVFLKKTQARNVSIAAPLGDIYNDFRLKGFFHKKINRPCGNTFLIRNSDAEIIKAYSAIIYGLLSYYRAADNFIQLKSIIAHLRKSCLFTLARKHNKSKSWAYKTYGDDVKFEVAPNSFVELPSRDYVSNLSQKFLMDESPLDFNLTTIFNNYRIRLGAGKSYFSRCAVQDCHCNDIEIHHVKKLHRKVDSSGQVSILNRKGKRVRGLGAILSANNGKQLPLCKKHHREFEFGKYSPLDTGYLSSFYNRSIPDSKMLYSVFNTGSYNKNS